MKKTVLAFFATAALSAGALLVAPSLAAPSAPEPSAPLMSLAAEPQNDDEVWGCIYTGPLNKKLCVDVTKTFCFRNAMFVSGRWYQDETCADLEARGAY